MCCDCSRWNYYFNSHPHEEDDGVVGDSDRTSQYFNSHPHEEDDHERPDLRDYFGISTHILTKRMTLA